MGRILVVEDDPSVGRLLELTLAVEGHDVEVVDDGASALARLTDADPPDLVVLDIMLPSVDGIAVLQQLRVTPGWEQVRVVVVSALDGDEDVWRAWTAGTDYHLTKPFELEELRSVTERLLTPGSPLPLPARHTVR